MHIIILVHSLIGGGAERVAALWATGFVERGYKVTVITQSSELNNYDISPRVNIINIPFLINNRFLYRLSVRLGIERYNYLKKLSKLLHKFKPDVCIGVLGAYARDAYYLTRDIGTHVIQTYHNCFELPDDAPIKRRKDIERRYSKDIDVPIRTVLTQADKDFIGCRMKNVYVLHNPLAFSPLTSIPVKKKRIMACGRLDVWEVKGFDVLIKAWGLISEKHRDWSLMLVGEGSSASHNYLELLAKKNNVEDTVVFVGFQNDIKLLYKESEIFVLSSRYEGFGMVLIEAMSQACACVACDYKGRQKEIIENENFGLICQPDNVEALATSIEKMIVDDDYRKFCQKNSLIHASNFSLSNIIDCWESIFQDNSIYHI